MNADTLVGDAGFTDTTYRTIIEHTLLAQTRPFVTLGDIAQYCAKSKQGTARLLHSKHYTTSTVREIRLTLESARLI